MSLSRLEAIVLFIALILANLRATIFVFLHPDVSVLLGPAWIEIGIWLVLGLAVVYSLARSGTMSEYLSMWRRNWLPALFILLTLLSTVWSIAPLTTLFSSLELLLAAMVASYFGMRLASEKLMDALFWFGALLLILSIALVFGAPPTGTMYWPPFNGAWRGVYWHRNHLASIAALLSIVYLCRMYLAVRNRNTGGILDAILYLVTLVILYFARSATGYIVCLALHGAGMIAWIWLQLESRLRRRHYIMILAGGVLVAILVLSNLDVIFGLFGRDTSMTGRTSLWSNLIGLAERRPWLGHGFGAV